MILSGMEAPHLNILVREDSLVEGAKKILSLLRPGWDLQAIEFKFFTDGITNKLLGCFNAHADEVVLIRVYGNKTDLLIDRKAETKNIRILHSAGLAPKLHATFDNGLVYEYVPGEVLTVVTCRAEKVFELVANKLADMHSVSADGYAREPALWKCIRKFLSLLPPRLSDAEKEEKFARLFREKPDLGKEYSFLEEKLLTLDSPIVFCHNDLLLGNVIYNREKHSVSFIDYEYTGYNYQAYDIANHFNEYAGVDNPDFSLFPPEDLQKKWLRIYLEKYKRNAEARDRVDVAEDEVNELYAAVQKFTLASHYLWGVWSLIQAEHSSIDFDFVQYAYLRLQEYYRRKELVFGR